MSVIFKKKQYCPHCHQPIMKHKHSFNMPLAFIIRRLAEKYKASEPFHLQKDIELSKNQYNNFQKLRYWDLVDKYFENGHRKGGYWVLTQKVYMLLEGNIIPRWVKTFNNKVVEKSAEMICLKDVIGYYDIPEKWAKRAEIALGSEKQLTMKI